MKWRLPFGHRNIKKAVILMLLAWLCFSLMYLISKLIGNQTSVPTMVFFRNVVGVLFILPFMLKKFPDSFVIKKPKIILLRAFSGLSALVFVFLAVQKISLVNTTLLNNTAPFYVPILLLLFQKTPINKKVWPAVVAGFIGVGIILGPTRDIFTFGAVYGLLAGVCLAVSIITMKLTTRLVSFQTFLFYFFFIGMVATFPFALLNWEIPSGLIILALASIGVCSLIGQWLFYLAAKFAKADELAPLSYSAVIYSGIFDAVFFRIYPPLIAYLGMALIIASGIWIIICSKPEDMKKI